MGVPALSAEARWYAKHCALPALVESQLDRELSELLQLIRARRAAWEREMGIVIVPEAPRDFVQVIRNPIS